MAFNKTAFLIFMIFLGVMMISVYTAFSRRSGNSGMDVGEIHLLREKEGKKKWRSF